jgi:septum formation protein
LRFVLASESARRVDLLRAAGYDFDARRSGFPEVSLEDPRETAETNARGKALAVAETTDDVVLAADTVVYLPMGPPPGASSARPRTVKRSGGCCSP